MSEVEEDGRADEIGEDVKGLECLPLRSGVSGWVMKKKEIKKKKDSREVLPGQTR